MTSTRRSMVWSRSIWCGKTEANLVLAERGQSCAEDLNQPCGLSWRQIAFTLIVGSECKRLISTIDFSFRLARQDHLLPLVLADMPSCRSGAVFVPLSDEPPDLFLV